MIKQINPIVCLVVCVIGLHAEISYAQTAYWSVSGSISFHRFDFDSPLPWWEEQGRAHPSMAVHRHWPMQFIEGPLGERLSFGAGLRYVRLSSKVDFELMLGEQDQLFTGAFTYNQYYLAIPLQLELNMWSLPLYVMGGPEVGILLTASRISKTFTPEESRSTQKINVTEDLRPINVSIYGGVGVRINRQIGAFARYGNGLSSVLKGGDQTVSSSDWSTREFEIGVKVKVER